MEWEFDLTDSDFGNLFVRKEDENAEPLENQTVFLDDWIFKVDAVRRSYGHTLHKTGMMQWEGGMCLGKVMHRCAALFVGGVILELGSGAVPLPSLVAARVGAQRCVITDGCATVVNYALANAERDRIENEGSTELHARRLVWGDPIDLRAVLELCQGLNWVVAADVVYNDQGTATLFKTISTVLDTFPEAHVLLAYVVRGVSEERIWTLAREAGLKRLPLPDDLTEAKTPSSTQLAMLGRRRRVVTKACLKCGAAAAVLVRQRDPLCVPCLYHNVEAKFRSLFKLKAAIQPGDRVLIEGAATVEAQTALELLLSYRNPDPVNIRRWKTHFELHVVQFTDASESAQDAVKALLTQHPETAQGIEIAAIEALSTDWDGAFASLDETSRADLKRAFRRRCLLEEAQRCSCSIVVSLQSSTALAEQLLAESCKGNGGGVCSSLDLFDRRFEANYGVTRIRLLKDLSVTELAYFCHFKKIPTVARIQQQPNTIDALTEQFIHSLNDAFPSGVSSLLRLGSKMKNAGSDSICSICASPTRSDYCYSCRTHVTSKLNSEELSQLKRL